MFPRALPICIVAALVSMPLSALAVANAPSSPHLWRAALALALLSWITPMIFAVNIRIVPVFSRRTWRWPPLVLSSVIGSIVAGWITALGITIREDRLETLGQAVALAAGVAFTISIVGLFRQSPRGPALPILDPLQSQVDRWATSFMRYAVLFLLTGLLVGVVRTVWTPESGRWNLVWAHLLLVGWMLHMVSGVLYHAASRWTGIPWCDVRLVRLHLWLAPLGTVIMVVALATDLTVLFGIGGIMQTVALALLAFNVLPVLWSMPQPSRTALVSAFVCLGLGVSLGATFVFLPSIGPTHRITHATLNVYGFTGLLLYGAGSYLLPRFFGYPLRWPKLVMGVVVLHLVSVLALAGGWAMQTNGTAYAREVITLGGVGIALAGVGFVASIAATVRASQRHRLPTITVSTPTMPQRR